MYHMNKEVEEIIKTKKRLLEDLSNNIFATFTNEEELLLHSKHGHIRIEDWVDSKTVIADGIVGAFKTGLPLTVSNLEGCIHLSVVDKISWDDNSIYR